MALVLVLLLTLTACVRRANQAAQQCLPPPPDIATQSMDVGHVIAGPTRIGGIRVGLALRDESVTVIGVCTATSEISGMLPLLKVEDHLLQSFGGSFSEGPAGRFNYLYYPPTADIDQTVLLGAERLATVRFPDAPMGSCALRATGHFSILECGAIILTEWHSPLRLPLRRMELLDVAVFDSKTKEPLSFYLWKYHHGPRGTLAIDFGFRPPRSGTATVVVKRAYLRTGDSVKEIRLDPPPMAGFALLPAGE
jgi:hypothetical protein